MSEIQSITSAIRHQEWADQVSDQARSGLSIRAWCRQQDVPLNTFKYRQHIVRSEVLAASRSTFAELREPAKPAPSVFQEEVPSSGISIEINGAVIRFDSNTPESLISSAVRAVRNA